jgi:mycofactocin system glycosyltransferase
VRYALDATWQRHGDLLLAGSPLRVFRTTPAGTRVVDRLEAGEDVPEDALVARLVDAGAVHPRPPEPTPSGSDDTVAARVTVVTPRFRGARDEIVDDVALDGRVVVDDGSEPPLAGATVRLPDNRGPAAARNSARPFVDTELVAFVDADVRADAAWIARLVWHFDDPRVGLVAPRVLGEEHSPLDLGGEPARIRAGTRVSYVPAAAIIVRVSALDEVGGFDERLRFGEDVDLVWRLDDAGWRCRYDPTVTVWHAPRASWLGRLRQHAGYGTSAAPLALRHPRALTPIRVNGWTATAWTGALTGHLLVGGVVAVGSAARLHRHLPGLGRDAAFVLAMRGHVAAGTQIAAAVRRTWWPIVAVGALVSKRCRVIGALSLAVGWRTAATDVAYGWGVWSGMVRHRTVAPIVPRLVRWPGRSRGTTHPARRRRRSGRVLYGEAR